MSQTQTDSLDLPALRHAIRSANGMEDLIEQLRDGGSVTVDGVFGSASALTSATLSGTADGPLLVVLPRLKDVDAYALELAHFAETDPVVLPAWDALPNEHSISDIVFGSRLRILNELESETPPKIIVTCLAALLQPVPSRETREAGTRRVRVGEEFDLDEMLSWLIDRGFDRVPAIRLPGEFSVRGSIVDIFPPDAVDPLRLELFGDEIESLRRFDVESQRKVEDLTEASLTVLAPVGNDDRIARGAAPERQHVIDSLPDSSWVVLTELHESIDEGKLYLSRIDDAQHRRAGLFTVQSTLAKLAAFPMATLSAMALEKGDTIVRLPTQSLERLTGPKSEALQELLEVTDPAEHLLIACHNEGERERLSEMLLDTGMEGAAERVSLCLGYVERGFRIGLSEPSSDLGERLVVIGDHELFNRASVRKIVRRKRPIETRAIDSFLDLREGDLVVHLTNGIGRYHGMRLLEKEEKTEEHLIIEFRGGIRMFVPVSLIHLVQKYVGGAKSAPDLSKVGGKAWAKKKEKVAEAVADMASDMLRLQALREAKPGHACPADSEWQREFAASFPYTETEDQMIAISEVKSDLMRQQPMDRLICGDVGFGKTEVAMRAAFKMVDAGRQVAILVPTTVLAEQHERTFRDRMAEFPVTVESLSRFKTKKQQRQTLERMASGGVDIVIGTHRIVQKDVRFKNLGLVIIDEEQRFGVKHKEMLKQIRLEVDVMTLSATPIPRTLHLSLLGIRDISNLTTPPMDRQPVETKVVRFDDDLVRRAIVRELNRGGQVYFVHNRVHNIHQIAHRIQAIVPEVRIAVGHGQMKESELEAAMMQFVGGEVDVLVSTTIIESGLDIPNANTIFINRASHFGLAELHQLRGRVGRDRHRAYCYLLLDEGTPLTNDARKRLQAIEEYSELGAGFKIAMRDLEIRGAGNILGTEQSGHISSVGYELYCQLLENAVRQMKGLPMKQHQHVNVDLPIGAFLSDRYVPVARQKVELYRRLSLLTTEKALDELAGELRDRFGPAPTEAQRLFDRKRLQIRAWAWGIDGIRLEDGYVVFQYRDPKRIGRLAQIIGRELRVVDSRRAYYLLDDATATNEALLKQLEPLLPLFPEVS